MTEKRLVFNFRSGVAVYSEIKTDNKGRIEEVSTELYRLDAYPLSQAHAVQVISDFHPEAIVLYA